MDLFNDLEIEDGPNQLTQEPRLGLFMLFLLQLTSPLAMAPTYQTLTFFFDQWEGLLEKLVFFHDFERFLVGTFSPGFIIILLIIAAIASIVVNATNEGSRRPADLVASHLAVLHGESLVR